VFGIILFSTAELCIIGFIVCLYYNFINEPNKMFMFDMRRVSAMKQALSFSNYQEFKILLKAVWLKNPFVSPRAARNSLFFTDFMQLATFCCPSSISDSQPLPFKQVNMDTVLLAIKNLARVLPRTLIP